MEQNLRRERVKWVWLTKILWREGADKRTVGSFYMAVLQAVLLFWSEKWFLTPRLEKSLTGFHHWGAR